MVLTGIFLALWIKPHKKKQQINDKIKIHSKCWKSLDMLGIYFMVVLLLIVKKRVLINKENWLQVDRLDIRC